MIGRIPEDFFSLPVLRELDLSSNELEGTIPIQIANLLRLEKVNLSANRLTGKEERCHLETISL
jgi:Leucine-rich repeat (LRR) protein